MSDQTSFDFIRQPERHRPRKPEYPFFGLLAGDGSKAIGDRCDEIMRKQGIFGRRIAAERLHISLSGLGSFKRIPTRIRYGAELAANRIAMPPFEVILDRAMTFPGGRPGLHPTVLLAKSDALQQLADSLFHELRRLGMKAGQLATPHVTLFYSPQSVRPVDIEPIRLWIDRFYLIHSERGLGRYNILGEWPLGGSDAAVMPAVVPPPLAFGPLAA